VEPVACGGVMLVTNGWNRTTMIWGPFLIIAGIGAVLRIQNIITFPYEIPVLVIVLGVLWMISRILFEDPEATAKPDQPAP
jgi:hypothetical protein